MWDNKAHIVLSPFKQLSLMIWVLIQPYNENEKSCVAGQLETGQYYVPNKKVNAQGNTSLIN